MPSADPLYIDHLLRYLAARLIRSLGAVDAMGKLCAIGKEACIATKVTRGFVIPHLAASVEFWYVTVIPQYLLVFASFLSLLCRSKSHSSGLLTSSSQLLVWMSSVPTETTSPRTSGAMAIDIRLIPLSWLSKTLTTSPVTSHFS